MNKAEPILDVAAGNLVAFKRDRSPNSQPGIPEQEKDRPGASLHKAGDRVAIAWLGKACGHCSYCIDGWETLCESQENSGYSVDGAWAEYAVAFDSHVVTVPEAVSSLDAAPLACAGVTTFHRGTRKDLADVFALHAAGRTKVIAQERHLDDVNLCIEEVLSGQVPARLVFTF
jgi:D-arabinose 1-dehydrogenase-like Zn-dependent alcohol dehydrogenase